METILVVNPRLISLICNTRIMTTSFIKTFAISFLALIATPPSYGRCLRHLLKNSDNATTTSPPNNPHGNLDGLTNPHGKTARPLSSLGADLDYSYYDPIGPFEMYWSFEGEGDEESIEMAFTLPSDIFIGIGFGCTSSKACDMVVGNAGGRNPAFIEDYFEIEGDQEPNSDVELGGTNDLTLVEAKYENWASTLRFKRKLNTSDKWDAEIVKGKMDLVYAWCEEPFCVDTHSAHAPGAWNIITVDLSTGA